MSKAFALPWDGRFHLPEAWAKWRENGHDVGLLEVRGTDHGAGRLIVHPDDPDFSPFVLVRWISHDRFVLAGWALGCEVKRAEYWLTRPKRPAYFLPNEKLRSIESLAARLESLCQSRSPMSRLISPSIALAPSSP